MTWCALVPAALCAVAAVGCGGAGEERASLAETATATSVGDTIATAVHADGVWIAALERNELASAGAVLDADFEWTNNDGRTRTRAETLETLQALADDLRGEYDIQRYHYGHLYVITSGRPGARMMRVWTLRPDGWRTIAVISTALSKGAAPFAATGAAGDCDNPCRTMPYTPTTENEKQIAAIFQRLKVDEWHPDPADWAPHVLDDVYYVTATAQLSKADRLARLTTLKDTGEPSVPGDPVVSMRIHDFGDSAVMIARHDPYRGGKPYYSLRVWAFRDGRWQLANTQQTVIADAPPAAAR